jgi:hypothetical protein
MRDPVHEPERESEARPRSEPPLAVPALLALQKTVGNTAVARMLQRVIKIGTENHDHASAKAKLLMLDPKPTITRAQEEWLRRLDQGDKEFASLDALKSELAGTAATAGGGALPRLNPNDIRFSQTSVQAASEEGLSIGEMAEKMHTEGYKESGAPDVVEVPSIGYVSVDNRRIVAARQAGLVDIPVKIHHFNDPLTVAAERFVLTRHIRQHPDGTLYIGEGKPATIVFGKGTTPTTWGEAVLFRTANQGVSLGFYGKLDLPTIRAPKTPTATPDTGVV